MHFYLWKMWSEMKEIWPLFRRLKKMVLLVYGGLTTSGKQTQQRVSLYPSCLWFVLLQWHLFWISESSPFLSSIQESLSRLLLQMPSKYTFTELMDKWVKLYILTNICLNFLIVLLFFYDIRNLCFIIARPYFSYGTSCFSILFLKEKKELIGKHNYWN